MGDAELHNWNAFFQANPQAHILQSPAWGELKKSSGWQVERVMHHAVGAQILFQSLPFGFTIAYLPRGPITPENVGSTAEDREQLLQKIDILCHQKKAVFLKVEPDIWEDEYPHPDPWEGFQISPHAIQPPRTIVISLRENEEDILSRMKSKTRYNIRLASRKEVTVRRIETVAPFYNMLEATAERADFGIHQPEYYRKAFNLFHHDGRCQIFLAEYQGIPLASIMVFVSGHRCWYFYGASSGQHRDRMPTYLVQWEAMRWAKRQGCDEYDLWGVPDENYESLEDQFLERRDGLWGVYRFKRGFGGNLKRAIGPWDRVYRPMLYRLYRLWNQVSQ